MPSPGALRSPPTELAYTSIRGFRRFSLKDPTSLFPFPLLPPIFLPQLTVTGRGFQFSLGFDFVNKLLLLLLTPPSSTLFYPLEYPSNGVVILFLLVLATGKSQTK